MKEERFNELFNTIFPFDDYIVDINYERQENIGDIDLENEYYTYKNRIKLYEAIVVPSYKELADEIKNEISEGEYNELLNTQVRVILGPINEIEYAE